MYLPIMLANFVSLLLCCFVAFLQERNQQKDKPKEMERKKGNTDLVLRLCVVCCVLCVACCVLHVVCGVWCVVVCGVWCVVCGVWCVVCGVWCVVLLRVGLLRGKLATTNALKINKQIPPILSTIVAPL
jgi:hypothetical protein